MTEFTGGSPVAISRLSDVLAETDERLRAGRSAAAQPWPTGFTPLDGFLSGGVRPGELTLVAGAQGLGKTTFALQLCRQVVGAGHPVLYVSFEHDAVNLLERLVAAEVGERAGSDAFSLKSIRALLEGGGGTSLTDSLADTPDGAEAVAAAADLQRFYVYRAGVDTEAATIASATRELAATVGARPLVLVDYVQKVRDHAETEEARMSHVAGSLKDLALSEGVPVVAITASDAAGIAAGSRLRTEHFRGASALAYEADVVLVLNEKYDVVARHHLMYGGTNAERYRAFAVLTIEKNRGGMAGVDLEFRKYFEQARFAREGQIVAEQLVDERMYVQ